MLRRSRDVIHREAQALRGLSSAMSKSASKQLVVCIDNEGYPASLERRKVYV